MRFHSKYELREIFPVIAVFFMVLAFGVIWIKALPFGYTESALLYLAAIVAASAFWVGRKH